MIIERIEKRAAEVLRAANARAIPVAVEAIARQIPDSREQSTSSKFLRDANSQRWSRINRS